MRDMKDMMRDVSDPRLIARRRFLVRSGPVFSASVFFTERMSAQSERPPQIPPDLVKEFVGKGHGDFARTKQMLAGHPGLLNVAWDWGGGDDEMAIGGAGHVGNREIAEFLVGQGARMTLFIAAMRGKTGIVRPILEACPEQAQAKGPHGLGRIHHAQKGGAAAEEVLEYLRSVGAS